MINHNIMNIIISKVALLQWQDKVKVINNEYHRYFSLNSDFWHGSSVIVSENECIDGYALYNWRKLPLQDLEIKGFTLVNHCVTLCKCGTLHPRNKYTDIELANRYSYSSGLNHPMAYKKIE